MSAPEVMPNAEALAFARAERGSYLASVRISKLDGQGGVAWNMEKAWYWHGVVMMLLLDRQVSNGPRFVRKEVVA